MISFSAKLYNVATDEEKDIGVVTIGEYVGSADMGNWYDSSFNSTNRSFSYNHANNLARVIEEEAKRYFDEHALWPTLYIYIANKEGYRFEWTHQAKDSLIVVTSSRHTIQNCLHFEDQNAWDSGIFSYMWSTASTISELYDYPASSYIGHIYFGIPFPTLTNSSPCTGYVSNTNLSFTYNTNVDYRTVAGVLSTVTNPLVTPPQTLSVYLYNDLPALCAGVAYVKGAEFNVGAQTFWAASKNTDNGKLADDTSPVSPATFHFIYEYNGKRWSSWRCLRYLTGILPQDAVYSFTVPSIYSETELTRIDSLIEILSRANADYDTDILHVYQVLTTSGPVEPGSDVDPSNPDAPTPTPSDPDAPDPYAPGEDPSRPSSGPGGGNPSVQPPVDVVPTPETPPSYVTTNSMFTLFNPSSANLSSLASFLWSSAWSVDTLKKIFANPIDCILGLMVLPHLLAPTASKEMILGNIPSGVTMSYFTSQFYDFNCGAFTIPEYYASYLDYAPYTKVSIFLPFIGDQMLDTDEVMGQLVGVRYRFDLATGDCVAFITVNGSVHYTFSGNCASRLPIAGNNWSGLVPSVLLGAARAGSMAAGVPALGAAASLAVTSMKQDISHSGSLTGSAGLMGVLRPYLIVKRPRQAIPAEQNSYTGYPSFITEHLSTLRGYTEVESCHLEGIPATDEEIQEIERLLKEGVLL